VSVAAAGDAAQVLLGAAGVFHADQSQVGHELTRMSKAVNVTRSSLTVSHGSHQLETAKAMRGPRPRLEAPGFQLVAAMITVSELGDIHRFCLIRVNSDDLPGLGQRGNTPAAPAAAPWAAILRCGNGHQRWLLTRVRRALPAASPKVKQELSAAQPGGPNPPEVRGPQLESPEPAPACALPRMLAGGFQRNKAKVAIARGGSCGFIWALLRTPVLLHAQPSATAARLRENISDSSSKNEIHEFFALDRVCRKEAKRKNPIPHARASALAYLRKRTNWVLSVALLQSPSPSRKDPFIKSNAGRC